MPSSVESLSEADRKKLTSLQKGNQRVNVQTYEKIVPISLNEELVIDVDDKAGSLEFLEIDCGKGLEISYMEKNPFDVYNDDDISEYRYPKDCDVKKKKSTSDDANNSDSGEGSINANNKRIRVNTNPLSNPNSHTLQIDTIDTDSLRDGVICLSERKRRKRAILNLSTLNAEDLVIEKILQRRKTGIADEYEYLVKLVNFDDTTWVSESVCKIKGGKVWASYQTSPNSIPTFESKEDQLIDEMSKEICDCLENDGILDALIDIENQENVNLLTQSNFIDTLLVNYSQDLSTLKNVKQTITNSNLPDKIKKYINKKVEEFLKALELKSKHDKLDPIRHDIALRKEIVKFTDYINKH